MNPDTIVHDIAAMQGGVVTRRQAIDAGLTGDQVDARLRSHRWRPLIAGCYRIFDMEGHLDLVRAAVAALPNAVASHFSAAAIYGMGKVEATEPSVLVHSRTTHVFPRVRVFRCHDLVDSHIARVNDLPTTTVARTIVDLAPLISSSHLEVVVDDVVAAHLVSIDEIRLVLDSVARRGKPGVRSLRNVLDDRTGDDRPASVLERIGNRLLVDQGIRDFETEFPIPWSQNRRFDVAFVESRVAIEWDSRRWHTQKKAFQQDRQRDRDALLHGWRVLRFTWEDVHIRPATVVTTIRALVTR